MPTIFLSIMIVGGSGRTSLADGLEDAAAILRRAHLGTAGSRAALAEEYQRFFSDYSDYAKDPRFHRVMLDYGNSWLNSMPSKGIESEPGEAMTWFKNTRRSAERGGDVWCRATLALAGQLKTTDIVGSRRLLSEVTNKSAGFSARHRAEAAFMLIDIDASQRLLDSAGQRLRSLLSWVPEESVSARDLRRINSHKRTSTFLYMSAVANDSRAAEQRLELIHRIVNDFPNTPYVLKEASIANARVITEKQRIRKSRPDENLFAEDSAYSVFFLFNVVAVVFLAGAIAFRRMFNRSSLH